MTTVGNSPVWVSGKASRRRYPWGHISIPHSQVLRVGGDSCSPLRWAQEEPRNTQSLQWRSEWVWKGPPGEAINTWLRSLPGSLRCICPGHYPKMHLPILYTHKFTSTRTQVTEKTPLPHQNVIGGPRQPHPSSASPLPQSRCVSPQKVLCQH